ncbi:hypothetical protein IJT17_00885 [bacterium]|nr:hypothetical protein [bacterium]
MSFPVIDDSFPRIVPSFRRLVKLLTECVEGGVDIECAINEFQECDANFGHLLSSFMNVVRLREIPQENGKLVLEIIGIFARISSSMSKLYSFMEANDVDNAVTCTAEICGHLKKLEAANQRLKEAGRSKGQYSSVPVIDNLLAAGRIVLDKKGDWDLLAGRLEFLIPEWNKLLENDSLPSGVAEHDAALDKLAACVSSKDIDGLEAALEEVKSTGEALMKVQKALSKKEEQVFACPRCGASFTKYERTCPSCHARMPEPISGTAALTEDAAMFEMMPDYVQKLFETVRLMSHNQKQFFGDFRKAVEGLRIRSENALTQLENLSLKQAQATTQAESEAMQRSFELAENGLTKFFNALEIFDTIVVPVDQQAVDNALEYVVAGVEDMRQMHTVIQDFRSISG